MRTTPERVSIYGSRFRLISQPRFLFIQDFLTFCVNLLPAPLSRRIRVPHFPVIKNISSRNEIANFTAFFPLPRYNAFDHTECSKVLPLLFIFKPSYSGIKGIYSPFYSPSALYQSSYGRSESMVQDLRKKSFTSCSISG